MILDIHEAFAAFRDKQRQDRQAAPLPNNNVIVESAQEEGQVKTIDLFRPVHGVTFVSSF